MSSGGDELEAERQTPALVVETLAAVTDLEGRNNHLR